MADVTFDPVEDHGRLERLLDRLEPEVRESFTAEQRKALRDALRSGTWRRQSVDIRLSVPLPSSRLFVTVVAGKERRRRQRRKAERVFHPLATIGNVVFFTVVSLLITLAAIVAVLLYSSVITA